MEGIKRFLLIYLYLAIVNIASSDQVDNKDILNNGDDISTKTTSEMWDYTQFMLQKMERLEKILVEREQDVVHVGWNILEQQIAPTREALKVSKSVCDESLPKRLDSFMVAEKERIRRCKRIETVRSNFHKNVEDATQKLDDALIDVVKEVSLCDTFKGLKAVNCFNGAYDYSTRKKEKYRSNVMANLDKEVEEHGDRIEAYWMGCMTTSMGDVRRANYILLKKLKCCQEDAFRYPCHRIQQTIEDALFVTPDIPDMDAYFQQIKGGEEFKKDTF